MGVDQVVIVNDATAALVGGHRPPLGVVCVAGTGSIAFGVNRAKGGRAEAGGHLLGDEGAATPSAWRPCGRCAGPATGAGFADGSDRTCPGALRPAGALRPDRPGLRRVGPGGRRRARPLVGAASDEGDAVAHGIWTGQGTSWPWRRTSVATRLGFLDPGAGPFQVVTSGGLWEGLRACAHASAPPAGRAPAAQVMAPRETPAAGAVPPGAAGGRPARLSTPRRRAVRSAGRGRARVSEDTSLGPTEQRNDRSAQIDRMETREILLLMNDQDATVPGRRAPGHPGDRARR